MSLFLLLRSPKSGKSDSVEVIWKHSSFCVASNACCYCAHAKKIRSRSHGATIILCPPTHVWTQTHTTQTFFWRCQQGELGARTMATSKASYDKKRLWLLLLIYLDSRTVFFASLVEGLNYHFLRLGNLSGKFQKSILRPLSSKFQCWRKATTFHLELLSLRKSVTMTGVRKHSTQEPTGCR